jgi:ArsR family transcriptional regulator, virulence genes transcriptional regulator
MPSTAFCRSKPPIDSGIAALEGKASEAAQLLKLLASETRLLIMCRLLLARELSVNGLVDTVGISQSALSQHLAKMRAEGPRHGATRKPYTTASPAVGLYVIVKSLLA